MLKKVVFLLQKMSEWVAVCADEAEEPVEIPTEADGETFPLFAISTFVEIHLTPCLLFRLDAAHISDRPVSGSNGAEIQESLHKHCQGCQDAGGGV